MSRLRRIRVDVYGRFRIDVIRRHGTWTSYRLGEDGKRAKLVDLVLADDAGPDEVVETIEALYHEWATPDAELEVIDVLMA